MTREEEIKRASVMYHLYYYDYSYEEGEHLDFYIKGFTEGAMWADEHPKNVWHDAIEEEPQGEYEILWQDILGYTNRIDYTEVDNRYVGEWGECVDHEGIVRWAYIKDLLPKGGER